MQSTLTVSYYSCCWCPECGDVGSTLFPSPLSLTSTRCAEWMKVSGLQLTARWGKWLGFESPSMPTLFSKAGQRELKSEFLVCNKKESTVNRQNHKKFKLKLWFEYKYFCCCQTFQSFFWLISFLLCSGSSTMPSTLYSWRWSKISTSTAGSCREMTPRLPSFNLLLYVSLYATQKYIFYLQTCELHY